MGDDIGWFNIRCNNNGMMRYGTPNSDRIAKEGAPESTMYYEEWFAKHAFLVVPAQALTAKWLSTLKEFPIRQRPASFNLDSVVERMMPRT